MFSKLVALCAFVAVAQAGILAAPAQYSPAEAVSSQSIVRHDQAQLQAAPLAKLAVAAPVYQAAPVAYQAAPARYSSAAAVSSQNIVRHDQPAYQPALAPIVYKSAPAPIVYKAAPAPIVYKSAPAPIVYKSAPAPIVYKAAPAPIVYKSAPAPIVYKSAPAPIVYKAAPAPIVYKAAPTPIVYKSAPVTKVIAQQEEIAYPKYEYSYSVADGHTGDNKSQQESRDGDVVRGSYSFQEADGSIRTVEYTADDHNGFNAVVQNSAPKAAVVKAAPLLVKAAPAIQYYQH